MVDVVTDAYRTVAPKRLVEEMERALSGGAYGFSS
jgi:hypothetical protein